MCYQSLGLGFFLYQQQECFIIKIVIIMVRFKNVDKKQSYKTQITRQLKGVKKKSKKNIRKVIVELKKDGMFAAAKKGSKLEA